MTKRRQIGSVGLFFCATVFMPGAAGQTVVAPCGSDRQIAAANYTSSTTLAASNYISSTGAVTASSGAAVVYQAGTALCFGPGFSFAASNNNSFSAIVAALPAISISGSTSLPYEIEYQTYTESFSATGGTGSYTWSVSNGPPGLSINSSGTLTGSPTATGSYPTFKITATDAVESVVGTLTVPLTVVAPIAANPSTLPQGTISIPYSQTITASGGTPPYTWTSASGIAGLSLASNGLVTGTPQASGNFTGTATVTDSSKPPISQNFTETLIINSKLGFGSTIIPNAAAQQPYSTTLNATGGVGPYSWSGTSLPAGLTLSPGGVLSGTPTMLNGVFAFMVTVTDENQGSATQTFTLTILPSFQLTDLTHPTGTTYLAGDSFLVTLYGQANQAVYVSTNNVRIPAKWMDDSDAMWINSERSDADI